MSWQIVAVVGIEALALLFLVYKLWPAKRRPSRLQKPDVGVSDLVRDRRPTARSDGEPQPGDPRRRARREAQ